MFRIAWSKNAVANLSIATTACAIAGFFAADAYRKAADAARSREAARRAAIARELAEQSQEAARRRALIKQHKPPVFKVPEDVRSEGPVTVATGIDGMEDPSSAWGNPGNVASSAIASVATATSGLSPSGQANTIKCRFNPGDFSLPERSLPTGVVVAFNAFSSGGMGSPIANVSSVKLSIGSTERADGATLTSDDSVYAYGAPVDGINASLPVAAINGAWEIDLVFKAPTSTDFGDVNLYNVRATVYYKPPPADADRAADAFKQRPPSAEQ